MTEIYLHFTMRVFTYVVESNVLAPIRADRVERRARPLPEPEGAEGGEGRPVHPQAMHDLDSHA